MRPPEEEEKEQMPVTFLWSLECARVKSCRHSLAARIEVHQKFGAVEVCRFTESRSCVVPGYGIV